MTAEAALVGVALTALAVVFGLVAPHGSDRRPLLIVPPLALALNLRWVVENGQVRRIGKYIRDELWPYVASLTDANLPSWEATLETRNQGRWPRLRSVLVDYTIPAVLAVAAFVAMIAADRTLSVGNGPKRIPALYWYGEWTLAALAWGIPLVSGISNWKKGRNRAKR